MANKRIIELDVTDVVEADDFLAIDSVSGKTRRIKPIKIGATYEIEDGDHSFTLVGSNGYSHTVDIPYDSVSMTQAEYDALTPAQKADGTARFITDGESDVESELWSKVGRQTLDTEAQVLSNAVNELKGDIDTNTDNISTNTEAISELNSSMIQYRMVQMSITTQTVNPQERATLLDNVDFTTSTMLDTFSNKTLAQLFSGKTILGAHFMWTNGSGSASVSEFVDNNKVFIGVMNVSSGQLAYSVVRVAIWYKDRR